MMRFFLTALMALFCFSGSAQAAKILFIQYSDSHSNYEQLHDFVRSVSALAQEFLRANPDGKVVVSANGDIAGVSEWAEYEHGDHSYELLAKLASSHYAVSVTLGNHEGFDIRDVENPPNTIFVRQNQKLVNLLPSQAVLAANIRPTELGKSLFRPFQDLPLAAGKKLRIIGMTVGDLFKESAYSFEKGPQLFLPSQPTMLETAKEQLLQAARDGIELVVFQCHDMTEVVEPLARELLEWKKTRPELAKIAIPLFGAGHKHEVHDVTVEKSRVVEAGAYYAFSAIEIGDDGVAEKVTHWSHADQKQFHASAGLSGVEAKIVERAEHIMAPIRIENAKLFSESSPKLSPESNTKPNRLKLGAKLLARSMRDWATEKFPDYEVVSFMNSLSFWDVPSIFEGKPLTISQLKKMIPFNDEVVVRIMRGRDIQDAYRAMREYGAASSSPFLTPHTEYGESLRPLSPDTFYVLVTDNWTGINGYRIAGVEQAFARAVWKMAHSSKLREVLTQMLPRQLKICSLLLN